MWDRYSYTVTVDYGFQASHYYLYCRFKRKDQFGKDCIRFPFRIATEAVLILTRLRRVSRCRLLILLVVLIHGYDMI